MDFSIKRRHLNGANVVFYDGHTEWKKNAELLDIAKSAVSPFWYGRNNL
ncbi:MAG: hypothetical protein GY750_07030 [Lentisphaerae bacterium]|nr:hypothetical protein [Lentisphaerota bacterium]MCP4101164.1 hypothetical protein [Lentisphaerota bacterium]